MIYWGIPKFFSSGLMLKVKSQAVSKDTWKWWYHMRQGNESQGTERNFVCLLTLGKLLIFKESQPHVLAHVHDTTCDLTRIN